MHLLSGQSLPTPPNQMVSADLLSVDYVIETINFIEFVI